MSAKVSISASGTSNPTVSELQKANKLIRQAIRDAGLPIVIPYIPFDQLTFGAFSDAAWAVRPDGSSQGGLLIFSASRDLIDGKLSPMGIIDWRSWKLQRKVRSSLAAESQAMADVVDLLNFTRLFVADIICHESIDLRKAE